MAIYIAADSPLPCEPWKPNRPDFHVDELHGELDESVRSQFSKPFVYYVGAHTGCGCGFQYGRYPEYESQSDAERGRRSVAGLSQYLEKIISQFGAVELYACWEGDQAVKPEITGEISVREIGGERFWFEEKQFLTIV